MEPTSRQPGPRGYGLAKSDRITIVVVASCIIVLTGLLAGILF